MWWLIVLPFLLQALVILVDEVVFHLRRGLPRWERIGHPLDTATVLLCFLFLIFMPFSKTNLAIYSLLAVFSSVFVTKDEAVHKEHCPWKEHWLHALLFTLHPLTFIAAGLIWAEKAAAPFSLMQILYAQTVLMTFFFVYQVVYWNFVWKEKASDS